MVDRTDSSTDNITTTEPSPMGQSSKLENRRWRWTAADIAVGAALGVAADWCSGGSTSPTHGSHR